jgi:hypothetical protein
MIESYSEDISHASCVCFAPAAIRARHIFKCFEIKNHNRERVNGVSRKVMIEIVDDCFGKDILMKVNEIVTCEKAQTSNSKGNKSSEVKRRMNEWHVVEPM